MRASLRLLFLLCTVVPVAVSAAPPPQAGSIQAVFDAIDDNVARAVEADGRASVSLGLVVANRLAHRSAFGTADDAANTPATTGHVYRIGSVTKQFTALAVLKLASEDKLRLSEAVSNYVPEIKAIEGYAALSTPITIRQLATMTSGLAREPEELPKYLIGPADGWFSVVQEAIPMVSVEFEPDSRYQYSNIGYAILGRVVEKASERDYMDYVRQEFLVPLEMVDSDFVPHPRFEDRIATGYVVTDEGADSEQPTREHSGRGYKVPNGAMYSTSADLASFLRFQMGGGPETILEPSVLADNLGRVNSADSSLSHGYGIGFQVRRRGELVIFGHGGSVAGYRAGAYFEPQRQLGVVLLRNATGSSIDVTELAFEVMELLVEGFDQSGKSP